MDLPQLQAPLKSAYRHDPDSAVSTLAAHASVEDTLFSCSVDIGQAGYEAHAGIGGAGTVACSGDLVLGALAACAQDHLSDVAESSGIPVERIEVTVEGDLNLRGTLAVARVPGGFQAIRMRFAITAPVATEEQIAFLEARTEQYCVVM